MNNLKRKILNKKLLMALITTAILVFLVLASNTTALAFTGDRTNVTEPGNTDVNYQFGYGEPYTPLPEGSTDIRGMATTSGRFIMDVNTLSEDGKASIHIPSGTIGLDKNLQALTYLTIKKVTPAPDPPEGFTIIGDVYDFGPSGATFDPPITIDLTYDPAKIPVGVDVKNLKIAIYVYDPTTGKYHWTELKNIQIDPVNHKLYGETDEFTIIAPLAPIPVATTTQALTTTPAQTSTTTPAMTSTSTSTSTTTPAPTSTTTPSATPTAAATSAQTNWGLIGGLIAVAVIVIITLCVYFLRLRKRPA
jgi:hypothetical protein